MLLKTLQMILQDRRLLLAFIFPALGACSIVGDMFPDRSNDHRQAKTTAPLEVPPDLTTTKTSDSLIVPGSATTLSDYTSSRQKLSGRGAPVLLSQEGIRFEKKHDRYWLVVQGSPASVWQKAREFWLDDGFLIVKDDEATGVLQTDWIETQADLPKGAIRSLISRAIDQLYSSAYRDRYRMRLERGDQPDTTELYITHQGVEEIGVENDLGSTEWGPRPRDPGLESEMLKRMMVYLGVPTERADKLIETAEKQAPAPDRSQLLQNDDSQPVLLVQEGYSQAWRSVGLALDRVDFAVEDRDRAEGIYYVRYNDPIKDQRKKGILSKLAFWSSSDEEQVERYLVKLTSAGANTYVSVLNAEGETEQSETAVRILKLLKNELH